MLWLTERVVSPNRAELVMAPPAPNPPEKPGAEPPTARLSRNRLWLTVMELLSFRMAPPIPALPAGPPAPAAPPTARLSTNVQWLTTAEAGGPPRSEIEAMAPPSPPLPGPPGLPAAPAARLRAKVVWRTVRAPGL